MITNKKRTYILIVGALVCGLVLTALAAVVWRGGYFTEPRSVFAGFVDALADEDYTRAQSFVTPGLLARDDQGKWQVVAVNCRVEAAEFATLKVWRLNRHYAWENQVGAQIVFGSGYAVIVDGKIVSIKMA
jgi:hypothetical protein